jgi:hypothetical protein
MNRTVPIVNNVFHHAFPAKLFAFASEYFIRLVVYTLMPNHYHLVLTQPCDDEIPGRWMHLGRQLPSIPVTLFERGWSDSRRIGAASISGIPSVSLIFGMDFR